MHISIANDTKKWVHAACAIRGLKMSQVVVEMIEQWLKANAIQLSNELHAKNCCELEFSDSVSDTNGTLISCETHIRTGCGDVGFLQGCEYSFIELENKSRLRG